MSHRDTGRPAPSERDAPDAELKPRGDRADIRTRFKPGQSGHRKGRPKGARGRKQIVTEIARETHLVMEGGKRRRRTTLELVLLSLRNRAIDGNVQAFRAFHDLLQRYAPQQHAQRRGFLIVPGLLPHDEWEKMAAEHQRKARGEPDPDSDSSAT